ncbi:unnamed protein product [Chrysodeixis includens]|uniref:Dynein axonemal assembly factor 1 homolog n=1 Tax=Chrysodeixis includens TaxID=689277 RepID=A0A9P0FU30_CHRIL|nr:unnamed protein product [Chrysodeixis includens]
MSSRNMESKTIQTETDLYRPRMSFDDDSDERVLIPPSMYGLGSLIKVWTESKIVSKTKQSFSVQNELRRKSIGLPVKDHFQIKKDDDIFGEEFPKNVTNLMNEENLWGAFYLFPEIFEDMYSPVVRVRSVKDVAELVGGVLTRDMVAACLSYIRRIPILCDYALIKLDLSSKHLINIDVLQHYKYLVYLDLSSNLLTQITVLSFLPYLQFLGVAFNRLNTVLEYETPQWFLSEVHYKYNSVKRIRDLTVFWSITILDLSHNNIKGISGLENLRYLRRLDLSFNHIQRLENLNHLRLLWLDLSYNNISSFEFGPNAGLWTLLHLEFLNLNENSLTSMKMFSYCTRLRELHVRNNRLSMLLELAVYMRQMKRLIVLDLRANPICSTPGYKDVVVNTFSMLLSLDAAEIDPIDQRSVMMDMKPEIKMHATRRLLRLLYIQQLSKSLVSPHVPPADTVDVPLVILVGHEGVGKGSLVRRLATECSSNMERAYLHTTAPYHFYNHYKETTREKFDDMLLAGDFLTYTEMDGESYGLSREEAFVKGGKVKIVSMDLLGALMLTLRGYRPYLILASCLDRRTLTKTQELRKTYRNASRERMAQETPFERSTLQVLLSGRIIITGIINEIIVGLKDEKEKSEFVMESECSLMMDSDARTKDNARRIDILALLHSDSTSIDDTLKHGEEERSLYSLFKESQGTDEYTSYVNSQNQAGSYQERVKRSVGEGRQSRSKQDKRSSSAMNSKGYVPESSKSSKSVTFTSQDADTGLCDPTGLMIEPELKEDKTDYSKTLHSISNKQPWATFPSHGSHLSVDSDLWLAFLTETGYLQASDVNARSADSGFHIECNLTKKDDDSLMRQIGIQTPTDEAIASIRDAYENIHRKQPGLFYDSVMMDNADEAFVKVRGIIKNIVNSQSTLKPMFDIDFPNLEDYPTVQKKLNLIRKEIAPQQLFY